MKCLFFISGFLLFGSVVLGQDVVNKPATYRELAKVQPDLKKDAKEEVIQNKPTRFNEVTKPTLPTKGRTPKEGPEVIENRPVKTSEVTQPR